MYVQLVVRVLEMFKLGQVLHIKITSYMYSSGGNESEMAIYIWCVIIEESTQMQVEESVLIMANISLE